MVNARSTHVNSLKTGLSASTCTLCRVERVWMSRSGWCREPGAVPGADPCHWGCILLLPAPWAGAHWLVNYVIGIRYEMKVLKGTKNSIFVVVVALVFVYFFFTFSPPFPLQLCKKHPPVQTKSLNLPTLVSQSINQAQWIHWFPLEVWTGPFREARAQW